MLENLKRKWAPNISRCQCVESRSPEEGRWKMYDSLHCGIFECRALVQSANQLSINGAVASWREYFAQLVLGQTHVIMEKYVARRTTSLSQKLEPRSGFFGTDTKEE